MIIFSLFADMAQVPDYLKGRGRGRGNFQTTSGVVQPGRGRAANSKAHLAKVGLPAGNGQVLAGTVDGMSQF